MEGHVDLKENAWYPRQVGTLVLPCSSAVVDCASAPVEGAGRVPADAIVLSAMYRRHLVQKSTILEGHLFAGIRKTLYQKHPLGSCPFALRDGLVICPLCNTNIVDARHYDDPKHLWKFKLYADLVHGKDTETSDAKDLKAWWCRIFGKVKVVLLRCQDKLVLPRQLEALIEIPLQTAMRGTATTSEKLDGYIIRDTFETVPYKRFCLIMQGITPNATVETSLSCFSKDLMEAKKKQS